MEIKKKQKLSLMNIIIISLVVLNAILLGTIVVWILFDGVVFFCEDKWELSYREGTTWVSEDQTIRLTYLEDLYYQGVITNGEEEIEVIFWTGGTSIDAYRIEEFVKGENNRDRRIEHWSIDKVRNNRIEIQVYETTYFKRGENIVLYKQ